MADKSIIAGSAKDRNIAETYVLTQNVAQVVHKLLANDSLFTEMRVLGFQLSPEDVQAIAYSLTENKTLKALSLDHLQIGDEGAKQLGQGLCYNETLTYLSLRWNNISNEGGQALADALHYNKGLKTLVLSFNNIGDAAGQSFAVALKRNTILETLDLKWNQLGDDVGDIILDAMSENKGNFTNLMLGGNGSSLRNVDKGKSKEGKKHRSMRFISGIGKKDVAANQSVSLEQLKKDLAAINQTDNFEDDEDDGEEEARTLQIGDLVEVRGDIGASVRRGRVRYIGPTDFAKEGTWVGVEFEGPVGLNDGSVDGKRYFTCPPMHGSFLRPEKLVYLEEVYEDE